MGELDALSELRAKFAQAEKTEKAAPKAKTAEAPKKVEAAPAAETGKELKDIAGVGPAAVKKMNAMGINSVSDLIALNEEKIAALVEQDSKTSADQWNKWVEGARAL